MHPARPVLAAAALGGGIYVAGGEVLELPFSVRDSVEVLDLASGTWSYRASLPGPLHGIGAVAYGGKMYVFGGAANAASASPRVGGVNIYEP